MTEKSSTKRTVLFRVLATGVASLLALGVVELCSGVLLKLAGRPPDFKDSVAQTLQWLDINLAPLVRDADLLWRNQPLASRTQPINPRPYGRQDTWTIENNSEGFRGSERSQVGDTADVYRVLCIGDSVTYGFNVDQPDSYPAQLQRTLEKRFPGRRIEVINAGVPGWSWLQGLRFLETRGLGLEPDLVIMAHGTNDQFMTATVTDDERFRQLSRPLRRELESLRLVLQRTRTYRAIERFGIRAAENETVSRACQDQVKSTGACKRVGLHEIERALEAAYELTKRAGVGFIVLNLDFLQTAAVSASRAVHERLRFPFLDLVAAVVAAGEEAEVRLVEKYQLRQAESATSSPAGAAKVPTTFSGLFRVEVPDPTLGYEIRGEGDLGGRGQFTVLLHDDGTSGDEQPNDGVFSARVALPRSIGAYRFKFFQGDTPEYESLPPIPSQFGDRVVRPRQDFITPIYKFGDLLYWAERTHPNARGHDIVASRVADLIQEQPSFRLQAE